MNEALNKLRQDRDAVYLRLCASDEYQRLLKLDGAIEALTNQIKDAEQVAAKQISEKAARGRAVKALRAAAKEPTQGSAESNTTE